MQDQYSRTQLLLGKEAMEKLHNSRVAVFGIGGVGGYTVEALARSGVGALDLIDDDKVCLTNLNRQIVATRKTVGQYKVDVAEQRIHEIDPNIKVTTYKIFFTPETQDQFDFTQYDYVVDAIDTVTGKIALVVKAKEAGTPIICAMGAGNKMDPTRFEVTDIYKTSVCPPASCPWAPLPVKSAVWPSTCPNGWPTTASSAASAPSCAPTPPSAPWSPMTKNWPALPKAS
jgi:tRNA A37 threonylcarbamoyladenosine dehydratase